MATLQPSFRKASRFRLSRSTVSPNFDFQNRMLDAGVVQKAQCSCLCQKQPCIRSNFVERIWMTSRRSIASAVLKAMQSDPWITSVEQNFREFMKSLNKLGGGIVFEALAESEIEAFVRDCVSNARR
jgi:hypothetical protein